MSELISIIVPIFNSSKQLRRCIDSILSQTYTDIELILVDDGSTDESGEICDEYAKIDKRIRVIHKENGGQSSARNIGIQEAQGSYLSFIDSDDMVSIDFLYYLYKNIIDYNAEMSICTIKHVNDGDKFVFQKSNKIRLLDSQQAISEMFYQYSWLESPCNKLYKKQLFEGCKFNESIIFEDSLLMPSLFEKCTRIVYGYAQKYAYIHRKNSTTTAKYSYKQLDILKITETHSNKYQKTQLQSAALAYQMSANIRVYLNAPETSEYRNDIERCKSFISKNRRKVLSDKHVRTKTKIALHLFVLGRSLFKSFYHFVNIVSNKVENE